MIHGDCTAVLTLGAIDVLIKQALGKITHGKAFAECVFIGNFLELLTRYPWTSIVHRYLRLCYGVRCLFAF